MGSKKIQTVENYPPQLRAKKYISNYFDVCRGGDGPREYEEPMVESIGYDTPQGMACAMIDCSFATEYAVGLDPRCLAAAAIYSSSLMFNRKVSQKDLEPYFEVSRVTIGKHSDELLELIYHDSLNQGQKP